MSQPNQALSIFRAGALLGMPIWLVSVLLLRLDWAPALLLLASLVCVPLGLALAVETGPGWQSLAWRAAALAQPFAAFCLVGSFAIWPGSLAAALSLPWLVFALFIALMGLERGWRRGKESASEGSIAAGMVFLAVGAGWTTLSRFGARPLDFGDLIVLLTGVHFHYAGFVLPVLTGLAGRRVPGQLSRLAAWGVGLGVPLVAFGITVGLHWPLVEALAAWFMAGAGLAAAAVQVRAGWQLDRMPRTLLFLSSLALTGGIALAAAYALGVYFRVYWLSVDHMILWHGTSNALGYALLGILGWTWVERARMPPIQPP